MKEVHIVVYTSMKGEQRICMVCEDEQDAIDFCKGHQCYSYDSWMVRESSDEHGNADIRTRTVPTKP